MVPGLAYGGATLIATRGKEPWTFTWSKKDSEYTKPAAKCKKIEYPKADGKYTFDILDNLIRSNVLMVHVASDQIVKYIKGVLPVSLWVFNLLALRSRLCILGVLFRPSERPRLLPARGYECRTAVGQPRNHARVPGRLEVTHLFHLLPDPRGLDFSFVLGDLEWSRAFWCCNKRLCGRLAREHACFHGVVAPLNLRHIKKACTTAREHAAWERE